ncbi:MAG: ABC transporter permease [Alphaproteobacteria bacterium]|nr:ABC transporter permease [Alphaproteobacteria bacterium]
MHGLTRVSATAEPVTRPRRGAARHGPALVSLVVFALLILAAVTAPWIAPYDPQQGRILDSLEAPELRGSGGPPHLLGTDSLGRDVWSGILHGARVSLLVGVAAVLGAGLIGTAVGLVAGHFRGWTDEIVMRLVDIQMAFPFIILAITIMFILGRGLLNVIVVLIVASWPLYARVVRAETLRLREAEYVVAARVIGCSRLRIVLRHVLPNALTPLIVIATFAVPQMIVFEAGLSFLGVGMPANVVSWGTLVADGRSYLDQAWWISTFPGVAIMLTVLSINILGDWLRDRIDPRLHNL